MAKDLKVLLAPLKIKQIHGDTDKVITDVVCDSRKAGRDTLYVAVRGALVDAHKFIPEVVASGAAAVVCEQMPQQLSDDVTYVEVENSSEALGVLASEWFDRPSEHLKLVAVTGTNG